MQFYINDYNNYYNCLIVIIIVYIYIYIKYNYNNYNFIQCFPQSLFSRVATLLRFIEIL